MGALRLLASLFLLLIGVPTLLLVAVVPGRVAGARLSLWVAVGISRAFLVIMGVRIALVDRNALRTHRGFVFFNHVSFLDVVVLLAVRPVRYLATAGVRSIPAIGWMATAVGTLYVHRGDPDSREEARADLAAAYRRSPTPVALAPEGGVHPGPWVQPFRHGAFEVAQSVSAPILLVALDYEPRGRAAWLKGESLLKAAWRLGARTDAMTVVVRALSPEVVVTDPAADAAEAEARIDQALGKPSGA